jgi:hypothetical protein
VNVHYAALRIVFNAAMKKTTLMFLSCVEIEMYIFHKIYFNSMYVNIFYSKADVEEILRRTPLLFTETRFFDI